MSRMTSTDLAILMHFNHRDVKVARRLVAMAEGYDWEGRPEPPVDPGCYIGEGSETYYRFHSSEKPPADLAAFYAAQRSFEAYPRDWPPIPPRAVRQAISRGWLEREGDILSVTPEGRDHWYRKRFGRPELATPRGSRKRRPQGQRKMFSAYRWHVQGRNRRGSTPQPAPHHAIHRYAAQRAAYEAHLAAGGAPDQFSWQPPEEPQERPPRRREKRHPRRSRK